MTTSQLQVVSGTEETSLIVGTYMIGPIVSGITICLLFALTRFATTNPKNNNITQYLLGIFSMLFTILLNLSYCILGTDLIVPWNDNTSLENDYDSNTMLEFTSLCIFLWYFGKLLFYISFIYYAYSFISLPAKLKQNLKYFMLIQIILTLFSVACLIYLNHNIYQIAITPSHNIQLITQLKGYFFYKNHSNSLTEIASMMPILSDISCLMILFKIYLQQSHQLQFARDRKTAKKFIDLCVRSIMLLFCGSLPTWILFINIFMKSSIIWILLPYDLLISNIVLFLMYDENIHLYKLFCVNCHKTLFYQCFFAHKQAKKDPSTPNNICIESKAASENIINQKMDGLEIKELKTDDEQNAFNDFNHNQLEIIPIPPPNSVDNSYEKKQFLCVEREQKRNLSDSEGSNNEIEISASNIIKQIVIGSEKKSKKSKKFKKSKKNICMDDIDADIIVNHEHFRKYDRFKMKRDIDKEIEATLNPFISHASSQTSIQINDIDHDRIEPFLCTPSSVSHSNNNNKPYASISGIVMNDNDLNGAGDNETSASGNARKRKYVHRRNTIDIVSHISDEINKNKNNVSVPSFGHDVHFSFFE